MTVPHESALPTLRHAWRGVLVWGLLSGAAAGLLAGCGGGGEDATSATQAAADTAALPMRAAAAAVDPATAADQLMNFAERAYPLYFPSHEASVDLPPYRYRFYPATGVYLGVADGVVHVMGGTFGGTPRAVGPLTAYITPVDLAAAAQLARDKACLACHAVDTRLIGPSFRSVSARYAAQPGAADLLMPRIIDGSSGVWGSIPMPPNFNLSLDEAKMLAAAILML